MGFIPNSPVLALSRKWSPLARYLERRICRPIKIVFAKNYEEVIRSFGKGRIQIALLGSFAYVKAGKKAKIIPLAQRVRRNTPTYYSVLAVRADSPYKTLADLRGKKIAFVDRNSTSGYVVPRLLLARKGIRAPGRYFGKLLWSRNHKNAVSMVYLKAADAAFFASTYWKPYSKDRKLKDLRLLLRSSDLPLGPFCVPSSMDPELQEKLKSALLEISRQNPATKDLAVQLKISYFKEVNDRIYDGIRAMDSELSSHGLQSGR